MRRRVVLLVLIGVLLLVFLPLMLFAQNIGPGYYEEDHPLITGEPFGTLVTCARCSNEQAMSMQNLARLNLNIVGEFLVLYFQHINSASAIGVEVCIDPPFNCSIIDLSKSVAADRVPYSWYFTQGEHSIKIQSTGAVAAQFDAFLVLGDPFTPTPSVTPTGGPTQTPTDTPTPGGESTQQVIVVAIPDVLIDPAQYYSNVDGQISSFQYRITAGDFIIALLLAGVLAVLLLTPFVRRISRR